MLVNCKNCEIFLYNHKLTLYYYYKLFLLRLASVFGFFVNMDCYKFRISLFGAIRVREYCHEFVAICKQKAS